MPPKLPFAPANRLGLSLAHLESKCTNIYDAAEVERVYYPEIDRGRGNACTCPTADLVA